MYDHEEDDGFEQFARELGLNDPIQVNLSLPAGETLVVKGIRLSPSVITVTQSAERNPKRDARMLATLLSTSLDEQTVFHLAEFLFAEHLAPLMQKNAEKKAPMTPPEAKVVATRKKKKEDTSEE